MHALLWLRLAWLRSAFVRARRAREAAAFARTDGMSPTDFERSCAEALGWAGWDASTTKGSGDQGIDVVARRGADTLVLQCKLYTSTVGNKAVQQVIAGRAYAAAQYAAVVSNAPFSKAARQLADRTGVLLLHHSDLRRVNELIGLPNPSSPDLDQVIGRLTWRITRTERVARMVRRVWLTALFGTALLGALRLAAAPDVPAAHPTREVAPKPAGPQRSGPARTHEPPRLR